jgi:hypothetical protein
VSFYVVSLGFLDFKKAFYGIEADGDKNVRGVSVLGWIRPLERGGKYRLYAYISLLSIVFTPAFKYEFYTPIILYVQITPKPSVSIKVSSILVLLPIVKITPVPLYFLPL